jgi:predicted molibdopterin-dependent oxidoreductase YjgC
MTNSFNEIARAKMFLVIGSNMTEAHPVAATFVKNAVLKGAELIVVDPRGTSWPNGRRPSTCPSGWAATLPF